MESERTLRLIMGPAILAGWLVIGALITGTEIKFPKSFEVKDLGQGLAVIAAGGVLLGVAGYVVSLISILAFRFLRWVCCDVELPVDTKTLEEMRNKLVTDANAQKAINADAENALALVVAHQTNYWPEKAIAWAERRWMNVGICANAIVGILLAIWIGMAFLGFPVSWSWLAMSCALIIVFFLQIVATRRELGRMHWLIARWSPKPKDEQK